MKISPVADLDIQAFSGAGITDYNSGSTNCVLNKRGEGYVATQRPAIDITEDSTTISGLPARARGIYYWEIESNIFIVNNDTVYKSTQDGGAVGGSGSQITAGTERVTILETVGVPRLVILDAQNNEGWVVNTPAATVTQIPTSGSGFFPTTLVHGGVILNSYLFVMDEDGIIYNSNVDDPTVFAALSFLEAERDNDKGVYLGKHHDHIVAFGTRTIEFFYDAGNQTGSPLNRRADVSYNIGCVSGLSVWENGDVIYFLGSKDAGQVQVYKLESFQVSPISNDAINSYITQGLTITGLNINCSGLSAMGHDTLLMNVYTLSEGSILPKSTISYDTITNIWGFWKTSLNSNTTFPLMAWTKRTGGHNATIAARTGEGLMFNGDVIAVNDRLIPVDTTLVFGVYEAGVYEAGVYTRSDVTGSDNIDLSIRTGLWDGDTSAWKFQASETLEMENTTNSQIMTIKHSDETSNNFDIGVTIDTSQTRKVAHQGGRFMKRNYHLDYAGDEQIFLESLDIDVQVGL